VSEEVEFEPVPGLPGPLPQGEVLLWQGAPSWWLLGRRTFRFGLIAAYFGGLAVWVAVSGFGDGGLGAAASGLGWLLLCGGAVIGVLSIVARLIGRATIYSITSRRVVIRHGVALPLTINLPFKQIVSAGLRVYPDGTGDIVLTVLPKQNIAYLALWPHARPWRFARTEPMLRSVPDAARVAGILAKALAEAGVGDPPSGEVKVVSASPSPAVA
jgi:hypothetical protein